MDNNVEAGLKIKISECGDKIGEKYYEFYKNVPSENLRMLF